MSKGIKPPSMLGMLGGGQLGKFFVEAAHRLGYEVMVLDPDQESPAGKIADDHICRSFSDKSSLDLMVKNCEAISTEFENIPSETISYLEKKVRTHPNALAISIVQRRIKEKEFIKSLELPIGPCEPINSIESFSEFENKKLFPAILKQSKFGYDGKGQHQVNSISEVKAILNGSNENEFILEKKLNLDKEISVVLSRSSDGESEIFPVIENQHEAGILDLSIIPARVSENFKKEAVSYALKIAKNLNYVGTIAVEFFISDDKLYVNEIAPRPHNSGHHTIESSYTSQYEQLNRILLNQPLGDTSLIQNAITCNIVGPKHINGLYELNNLDLVLQIPGVYIHMYGKKTTSPNRKLGHYTILGKDSLELESKLNRVKELLTIKSN